MGAAGRIGDYTSGICDVGADCCPHDGRLGVALDGSSNVFINGIGAHRVGDEGEILECAHKPPFEPLYFTMQEGSRSVFINGRQATGINCSRTECQMCGSEGWLNSGSDNVFIGG